MNTRAYIESISSNKPDCGNYRWQGEPENGCALYHYRDKDQHEVDLVIETGSGALVGIEVKASATVNAGDFKGLRKADACSEDFKLGLVLYDGARLVHFGDRLVAAPMSCLWAGLDFFAVFRAQWREALRGELLTRKYSALRTGGA